MIKYAFYQRGKETEGSSFDYKIPSHGSFIWIFLEDPSEKEIGKVAKDFKLNKKHFLNYKKETRSIRYSFAPLSLVILDYYMENKQLNFSHVLFILKENCLITVVPKKSAYHENLFFELTKNFKEKKRKEISHLLTQFLYEDAQENYDVLEDINDDLLEMEETIVCGKSFATKDIQKVFLLKRTLFKMSRRFWGAAKLVFTLRKGLTPVKFGRESSNMLDDIYDTYIHQIDILASEREMLSDTLAIYTTTVSNHLAEISNDLNQVMKALTSLTVIIMVPTLIAGIYGMNVINLPTAQKSYGFLLIIGGMASLMFVIYMFFKRKKWI